MKKSLKIAFLFLTIIVFIFIFIFIRFIFLFFPSLRSRCLAYLIHIFGKIAVFLMGIRINISGSRKSLKKRGVFFVSNHLSYLDGIVASSIFPLVFIGRGDLKKWPLFGVFTLLSDTIFVNRISYSGLRSKIKRISFFLDSGVNVILFPEGTSTDGTKALSFKSSFFEAPLLSQSLVIPFAIKYTKINDECLNNKNKDLILWYGDMLFFPHLIKVLSLKNIDVEVRIFTSLDASAIDDRKHLSNLSKKIIEESLNPEEANV